VTDWECTRKDDQGTTWTLSGYDYSPASGFSVTADQAVVVGVGEPVTAALQLTETRSELAFSLRLLGRGVKPCRSCVVASNHGRRNSRSPGLGSRPRAISSMAEAASVRSHGESPSRRSVPSSSTSMCLARSRC
jgi:hypothetical protein